ncbi:MAG: serine/threonine protein kinase [Actinomycetia bacterium]|nr:serine/threonine protein kinase [Actinomycetes bacterium]
MTDLILDRYRPLGPLGSGGQADVLVAFDEQMKRRVAIKCVPLSDIHASAAAIEEARTAAMLNHPNIVTMYDFAVTDDRAYAYLIMEYIEGIPLLDIASADLSDEVIAAVVRDVGDALEFAHKNGVVHLDIKPANIIINHEGLIKVIDFGVSSLSQVTGQATASAGTVGYMPLEQLTSNPVGPATDQWAYAAVIYELLADEFPYEEQLATAQRLRRAPSDQIIMQRLQTADEPNLMQTKNPILNQIVARALTRAPESRFASVKELRSALLKELPQPRSGHKQLAEIVSALTADEIYTDEPLVAKPSPFSGCVSVVALLAAISSVSALLVMGLLQTS